MFSRRFLVVGTTGHVGSQVAARLSCVVFGNRRWPRARNGMASGGLLRVANDRAETICPENNLETAVGCWGSMERKLGLTI